MGGHRDGRRAVVLLAPALVGLAVFGLAPAILAAIWGGTDKLLTTSSFHWTGWSNAREALDDPAARTAAKNTLIYCGLTIVPAVVIGLVLAQLVQRVQRGRAAVRLLLFLPVTANLVAMSVVFKYIFADDKEGLANAILAVFGVAPVNWLGDSSTALPTVAAVGLWRLVSFVFVIYLAGLTAIPASVYEAADLDGLRGFARFRWITWPLLRATTVFVLVLCTLLTLQTFETVAVLTQGEPLGATTTIVYYIWEVGFTGSFRLGYASALSLGLILVVIAVGIVGGILGRRARARAALESLAPAETVAPLGTPPAGQIAVQVSTAGANPAGAGGAAGGAE